MFYENVLYYKRMIEGGNIWTLGEILKVKLGKIQLMLETLL